jgi:hypothetical protein
VARKRRREIGKVGASLMRVSLVGARRAVASSRCVSWAVQAIRDCRKAL